MRLRELLGPVRHSWPVVAGHAPLPAVFDNRQISTDRISSVQHIKFRLTPEQAVAFPRDAKIPVDHPKFQAGRRLTAAGFAELSQELR